MPFGAYRTDASAERSEDLGSGREAVLLNVAIAALLMLSTTIVHAAGMMLSLRLTRTRARVKERKDYARPIWIAAVVVLLFVVSLIEGSIFAFAYVLLDEFEDFEQALYFSMVTFTTLGYGDVVLSTRWQLLASFQAANGIIMFGWTTAIVIASVQRIYFGANGGGAQR
jgi:hypothetical protein